MAKHVIRGTCNDGTKVRAYIDLNDFIRSDLDKTIYVYREDTVEVFSIKKSNVTWEECELDL